MAAGSVALCLGVSPPVQGDGQRVCLRNRALTKHVRLLGPVADKSGWL